jgi:hypothetical protein
MPFTGSHPAAVLPFFRLGLVLVIGSMVPDLPIPGYRSAQYASGIVGAVAIGGRLLRWWRRHRPVDRTVPGMATRTVSTFAAAGGG